MTAAARHDHVRDSHARETRGAQAIKLIAQAHEAVAQTETAIRAALDLVAAAETAAREAGLEVRVVMSAELSAAARKHRESPTATERPRRHPLRDLPAVLR